tara:strand:- start:2215 stop:2778 length:564 start_codon:yes stop_codon:yes gene_type:complete
MKNFINNELDSHQKLVGLVKKEMQNSIIEACEIALDVINSGNKIIFCGNGGSAADSQHLAAEFVGRYKNERRGLPSIALTTDSSILTAVGNDYSYDYIFERQIEALANEGDLLIGISTSGNSKNVINAIKKAKQLKCIAIGFTGNNGGLMKNICDINLVVPSSITARIQEVHILIGHIMCKYIDEKI